MLVKATVLKGSAVRLILSGFLIILLVSLPTGQTSAQQTVLEDTRDISVRINDPVFLTSSSPVSLAFSVKAGDIKNVDVRRDSSSVNFTFFREGFYLVLTTISPLEPDDDVRIFLGRVSNQESRNLGSYLLSGGASLDLTLRITARAQGSNSFLVASGSDATPSTISGNVRLVILIAPLAYLGGFVALDISNYLHRKNFARPRDPQRSYRKWAVIRYAVILTLALAVIIVTILV